MVYPGLVAAVPRDHGVRGLAKDTQPSGCNENSDVGDTFEGFIKVIWVVVKNCDLFLGTLNIRCRIIIEIQKITIILTSTHIGAHKA